MTLSNIKLRRAGQFLTIDPVCRELAMLQTVQVKSEADRPGEISKVSQFLCWGSLDSSGKTIGRTWAGLAPVVATTLAEAGYRVTLHTDRPTSLPPPAIDALRSVAPIDLALLRHVRDNDRVLVRVDLDRVDIRQPIAQIALSWPSAKVLVLATRTEVAKSIYTQLRRHISDISLATGEHPCMKPERVVIGLPGSIGMVTIEEMDFVICANALDGLRGRMLDRLRDADRARLLGFVDRSARLSPHERDLLIGLFGIRRVVIPQAGFSERPVDYAFFSISGGPPMPSALNTLQLKRQGIWRHPIRNRMLVQIARALQTGSDQLLRFPELSRGLRLDRPLRIVMLTENVEHALALASRLPDWSILTGPEVDVDGLSRRFRRTLHSAPAAGFGPLGPLIVTASAVEKLDLTEFDVLIVASGGTGLPPLDLPRCLDVPVDEVKPLRIIDFGDRHHPQLRRWSRSRREAYTSAGWCPAGIDPEEAAVEEFLRLRRGAGGDV